MGRKGRNAVCSGLSLPKTGPMIEGKIIIAEVLPRSEGLEPYISFPSLGVLYQDEKPPECLTQSWGSASEAAFLISSQVMLILIQGSFLENHWFRL